MKFGVFSVDYSYTSRTNLPDRFPNHCFTWVLNLPLVKFKLSWAFFPMLLTRILISDLNIGTTSLNILPDLADIPWLPDFKDGRFFLFKNNADALNPARRFAGEVTMQKQILDEK